MPRRAAFLVVSLFVALVAPGCESAKRLLADAQKPTASVKGVALKGLDLKGATLAFDVEVANPYGVPLPVAALDASLASGGAPFATAASTDQGVVPAGGTRVFPLLTTVSFDALLKAVSGLRPGAVAPYAAELGVAVDAPALGRLRLPMRKEGEIPVPTIPDVSVREVKWSKLSLTEAVAVVSLDVGNTNQFPFDLSSLSYALSLGGVKVAETSLASGASFAPGAKRTLDLPLALKPSDLGAAAFRMLTGSGASYAFDGRLAAKTAFGELAFPVAKTGSTTFTK